VYQLSIGAACGLAWPADRIIVQVLDDSTDPVVKVLSHLLLVASATVAEASRLAASASRCTRARARRACLCPWLQIETGFINRKLMSSN
jgi:hypothetical protein